MEIKKYPIDQFHVSENNPRLIKENRFKDLVKSLKDDPDFLNFRPILVDPKNNEIYAGNMRWQAAKHLGWTEIPAIVEEVSEEVKKARTLRDNVSFGEWNYDVLSGYDLPLLESVGLTEKELGLTEEKISDKKTCEKCLKKIKNLDKFCLCSISKEV